MSNSKADERKL